MKSYFIIFTIGLLLGIYLSFMYLPSSDYPTSPASFKKTNNAIQKEVAKSEVKYVRSFDSLQKRHVKLQAELENTKKVLLKAKEKTKAVRSEFSAFLNKRNVLKSASVPIDAGCDSFIVKVDELIQTADLKDSLYERVIANVEEQLKNKDSTISVKNLQYAEIKSALTKTIERHQSLSDQNKCLNKDAKRHKVKSKVLSAALFILTGIAANHLMNH